MSIAQENLKAMAQIVNKIEDKTASNQEELLNEFYSRAAVVINEIDPDAPYTIADTTGNTAAKKINTFTFEL